MAVQLTAIESVKTIRIIHNSKSSNTNSDPFNYVTVMKQGKIYLDESILLLQCQD